MFCLFLHGFFLHHSLYLALSLSCMQAQEEAGKHRLELRRRGVSLVCVETKSADPGSALKALKAEFR